MKKGLHAVFFAAQSGREPVKEFFKKELSLSEMEKIYTVIRTIERSWPLGKPLVDHIKENLWEIRCKLRNRILRVFFANIEGDMVLLHGFIKKTQKTPKEEIEIAERRLKEYEKHS